MPTESHHIERTTFDVRVHGDREAILLPQRLERLFERDVLPGLDLALRGLGAEQTLVVDRIEVDLGTIRMAGSATDIAQRLRAAITRSIRDAETLLPERTSSWAADELLRFVSTGTVAFPGPSSLREIEAEVLTLPGRELAMLAQRLADLVSAPGEARRRTVLSLTPAFLQQLRHHGELVGVRLPVAARTKAETSQPPASADAPRGTGWEEPPVSHEAPDTPASSSDARQHEDEEGSARARARRQLPESSRGAKPEPTEPTAQPPKHPLDGRHADPSLPTAAVPTSTTDEHQEPVLEQLATERLATSAAGLCLVHPFLQQLFETCGLLGPGRRDFGSRQARETAVHLLWRLGKGSQPVNEPEALLCKYLCGWPLHWALDPGLELQDRYGRECSALLDAVAQHWSALGATSGESLRAEFIDRQGTLSRENERWTLTVEQRSIDVLLDRLPWLLSPIRAAWLPEPLFVVWG